MRYIIQHNMTNERRPNQTIEQVAEAMQIDDTDIEWAIEQDGKCTGDEWTATEEE